MKKKQAKKKVVLDVWARNLGGCVKSIQNELKTRGEFYGTIELFETKQIFVDYFKKYEVIWKRKSIPKHLKITIEEI